MPAWEPLLSTKARQHSPVWRAFCMPDPHSLRRQT